MVHYQTPRIAKIHFQYLQRFLQNHLMNDNYSKSLFRWVNPQFVGWRGWGRTGLSCVKKVKQEETEGTLNKKLNPAVNLHTKYICNFPEDKLKTEQGNLILDWFERAPVAIPNLHFFKEGSPWTFFHFYLFEFEPLWHDINPPFIWPLY